MAKRFLLVARSNNYGLTSDAALLADAISAAGEGSSFAPVRSRGLLDILLRRRKAEVIVHLERAFPRWFSGGDEHWLIPNQERFPRRHIGRLKRIGLVLAKTRHAETIFAGLGVRTAYLGFTARDRLDASVERNWDRFFHLAGASTLKGTEDVLALWSAHPEWPELVLVQKADNAPETVPANVRLLSGYLADEDLKRLQNECGIHLCPSRAEGWGHNIVEGLSVGALVITADALPMNELVTAETGMLVAVARDEPRHLGTCYFIDRAALEGAVERAIAMPVGEKERIGAAARARFKEIDAAFRARVAEIFGGRR